MVSLIQLEHDDDGSGNFRTTATTQLRNYLTGKKPVLHIDESILHILDLVVVTWSYVEQRRREMIWGGPVFFVRYSNPVATKHHATALSLPSWKIKVCF